MKTIKFILQKIGITILCVAAMGYNAGATVFTAVLSGDFNSALTWGGIIPGSLISTDEIVIPAGITVTLNTDEAFSSTSSLIVDGTLTSGGLSTALTLTSGTLSGTGSISVDSLDLGLTSGFSFTGSIMASNLTSTGANIATDANVTVSNTLMLTSGALNFTAGTLTMGNNSNINLTGGTLSSSGSGVLDLDSTYNVTYSVASAVSGPELSGTGLNNITLNLSGTITLSSNLGVNGTLALTSGTLSLNGHTLTFNAAGNLTTSAGNISGSGTSGIMVMSSGGLTGTLNFASGGNTLHEFTINMGSGSSNVSLGSSLDVTGTLDLQTGTLSGSGSISADSLDLGTASNLTYGGSIMADNLQSMGTTLSSAATNVTVSNALMLNSGALNISAGNLTMGNNSNIYLTGGTLTSSGSGILDLDSAYNVTYTTVSATAGAELTGTGLHNITLNLPGTVTLSSNLGVNGTLALTSGTLAINGHNLTINTTGNLTTGTGNIMGSSTSNITVLSTGSLTGALNFASSGDSLHSLTINMGSATSAVSLGSSVLYITGMFNLETGTLSGSGSITADSLGLGSTANLTYTGSIETHDLNSLGANISAATNLTVDSTLTLNSGALNFTSGSLIMGNNSNINVTAGTLTASGSGSLDSDSVYNVTYSGSSLTAGSELSGTGLHNVTVNLASSGDIVTLSSNLGVNGTLALTSGTLSLNGHNLTINSAGNLTTGTGNISGSGTSDITVMSTGSLTGAINFATGGNTLHDLIINTGSGSANVSLGGSSLNVTGGLNLQTGTLSGSGSINTDSLDLGPTATLAYSGDILSDNLTSLGTTVSSGTTNVKVSNALMLNSGALDFTAGNLTMGNNSNIYLTGGTLTSSGSGVIDLDSAYNVTYTTVSATAGAELTGTGLHNITLNLPGMVTLSSNLGVNGTLALTSGTLSLNGHNLTFNTGGNLTTGTGDINASSSSDISVMSSGSLTGMLNFASGGNTVNNFTVDMGGSGNNVTLGTGLNVNGMLNLQNGNVMLGTNNLMVNTGGTLMGGTPASYVITNGSGQLMMNLMAGNTDTFKIGTAANFSPMAIQANTGSTSSNIGINVTDNVYANGTSGTSLSATDALVNATWFVNSSDTVGINLNMYAMWNASMEVNGFDRTHSFISHYTDDAWDTTQIPSAAIMASYGLYMMSRTGITTLSPFMVADRTFISSGVASVVASNNIVLFPNPATTDLHFTSATPVNAVCIYDMSGQLVGSTTVTDNTVSIEALPAGVYSIHLTGENFSDDKKFVKE